MGSTKVIEEDCETQRLASLATNWYVPAMCDPLLSSESNSPFTNYFKKLKNYNYCYC